MRPSSHRLVSPDSSLVFPSRTGERLARNASVRVLCHAKVASATAALSAKRRVTPYLYPSGARDRRSWAILRDVIAPRLENLRRGAPASRTAARTTRLPGTRGERSASGTFGEEAGRARESRHSSPFFPLSRHGPAGSSPTAGNADRAVL